MAKPLTTEETLTPEQVVLDEIERAEIWRLVIQAAVSEQERVMAFETFVRGIPSREILRRYPDKFGTVADVYSTKRNFLQRLSRNPALRALYRSH
jgi:hypothetical protein